MHDRDVTRLELLDAATEYGAAGDQDVEAPLSEADELELATELLEVADEEELEQFIGGLISRVRRRVGGFLGSDTGRALTGILKDSARAALPVIGRAAGQWIAPGRGGGIGARIAADAGRLLGLELEGLSPEDKEFELARQFVRFSGAAASQACVAPPTLPAARIAAEAAARAAQVHAPGLAPRLRGRSGRLWPRSGRWVRHGRSIVLMGG